MANTATANTADAQSTAFQTWYNALPPGYAAQYLNSTDPTAYNNPTTVAGQNYLDGYDATLDPATELANVQATITPMADQLKAMGPAPSGSQQKDPAAVSAWLMKNPYIAAQVNKGNGTPLQVAP